MSTQHDAPAPHSKTPSASPSPLAILPDAPARAEKWRNPYRALPRVRWVVQLAYVAFLLLVAWQFVRFHDAVLGDGPISVARPPAVEAFLPIAALVAAKRFFLTRYWDVVHPAGLTIFLAAIATAFVARKAFCSWVCPVGTISRALEWLGRKTLWRRRWPAVPRWLDLPLSAVKYLLLAFFLWTVVVMMPLEAIEGFMQAPYNLAADAKMLELFAHPSATMAAVLGGLVALSLVVKHAWCRWLCPYGALLGLASFLSPVSVRRDPDACNDCRACTRACPNEIQVHAKLRVLSTECTGCMSCVAACSTPDCLGVTRKGARAWSPWLVPAATLAVMLGFWAVARATGFWEASVPPEVYRVAYRILGIG
ncbi:4Fe-4S binding protein [Anaeromyxobacter oryzae]|uniref:(4Fe-4S)-binding protein n=1 Tax=Anaeromyxobacter oryzae TaxID=2918170 RepID=A0ABN6MTY3_9BACT|nr:4Fe-4S binding protein [Anaeromyxobacter oryzae]BDG04427.1 (4Fe-4S)-binding protein [Anaeromyxobacter oryzae]